MECRCCCLVRVPDKAFVELLAEERERSGKSMSLDGLLILDKLKSERRCGFDVLSALWT